jgi:hypothetical protein
MLFELAGYITGFNVICIAVGILRDVLGNRKIGNLDIDLGFEVPALSATFGGLIVIGIAAGMFRWHYTLVKTRRAQKAEEERIRQKIMEEL